MDRNPDGPKEPSWLKNPSHRGRVSMMRIPNGMVFHARDNCTSGMLVWYGPEKIKAFSPPQNHKFGTLAQGNYTNPEEGPIGPHGWPKSDFLMLVAARGGLIEGRSDHPDFDAEAFRRLAILTRLAEIEKNRGTSLSAEHRTKALKMAESESKFENYLGQLLVMRVQEKGASVEFSRLADWLKKIEKMEDEGVPAHYQRFLESIEIAAKETLKAGHTLPIPVQKVVRAVYEKELNSSQLGAGTGFDTVLEQLKFEWLPPGGRGPDKRKRSRR